MKTALPGGIIQEKRPACTVIAPVELPVRGRDGGVLQLVGGDPFRHLERAERALEITDGAVVNGGLLEIGNGIVDVLSGGTANVFFTPTGSGELRIADAAGSSNVFTGAVSGFGGVNHSNHKQFIDLVNVNFASGAIPAIPMPSSARAAMMPATAVPCDSATSRRPSTKFRATATCPIGEHRFRPCQL